MVKQTEEKQNGLLLENITARYTGAGNILENVSFYAKAGEIVALLGASGSGKSTLLRVIAGLEDPVSGGVFWNGVNQKNIPVHKRGFGLMFQDGQLFTHMSVAENIEYGMKVQKIPARIRKKRVRELLAQIDLAGFSERSVTTLSGGQAQRVALARSLAADPKLLMLDEPLSSLDSELRGKLAEDLRLILKNNNVTAILVTHDPNEAEKIADRIIYLRDGRLVAQ